MAPLTFPLINGNTFDFSSIELDAEGRKYNGFKSIEYDHSLEPGEARGNRAQVVGTTRGQYSAAASAEMYKSDYAQLIAQLGNGYMTKRFPITVSYAEAGQPIITDRLFQVRIKKAANSHSEGGDPLTVKLDLHVMRISENGLDPVDTFNGQFLK